METMYQRGRIQEDSLYYETRKHDSSLPIVGVNTFLGAAVDAAATQPVALSRSSEDEKRAQVAAVRAFQRRHAAESGAALDALRQSAARGGNVFGALLDCVRHASLGQMSHALYAAGGQYRRNV